MFSSRVVLEIQVVKSLLDTERIKKDGLFAQEWYSSLLAFGKHFFKS